MLLLEKHKQGLIFEFFQATLSIRKASEVPITMSFVSVVSVLDVRWECLHVLYTAFSPSFFIILILSYSIYVCLCIHV